MLIGSKFVLLAGGKEKKNEGYAMNERFIESAILFLLVLNMFRIYAFIHQLLIAAVGVALVLFLLFSLPFLGNNLSQKIRIISFGFIIIFLFWFTINLQISARMKERGSGIIHDGGVQTEIASRFLTEGKNPYSVSYGNFFKGERFYHGDEPHPLLFSYAYSPLTAIINTPFLLFTNSIFKFVDFRITTLFFFVASSLVGAIIARKKILFLILFLLNPLMVHMVFLGTTDVIPLFFVLTSLVFLSFKHISLATVSLAMATGSKLTAVPFVPLYFLYLFALYKGEKNWQTIFKRETAIFIGTNLIIYSPFLLWDAKGLISDLIFYPIAGGNGGFPIEGMLGIPAVLVSFGLLSSWSNVPFYFFQIPIVMFSLFFAYRLLQKSLNVATLCVSYALFFIIVFSLSRVFSPNYLDMLSGILLMGGFIYDNANLRKNF